LKTSLLDAERYREELRVLQDEIAVLTQKIEKSRADLDKAKEDLRQARLQGAMPQSKTKGPKFNKDTKVCTKHAALSDWLGKPQKKVPPLMARPLRKKELYLTFLKFCCHLKIKIILL